MPRVFAHAPSRRVWRPPETRDVPVLLCYSSSRAWAARSVGAFSKAKRGSCAALASFERVLAGREAIYWIDNMSVCSAFAKGASKSVDIQVLTTAFHRACLGRNIARWIEWVSSESKPSDALSRLGCSPLRNNVLPAVLAMWVHRATVPVGKCFLSCMGHSPGRELQARPMVKRSVSL